MHIKAPYRNENFLLWKISFLFIVILKWLHQTVTKLKMWEESDENKLELPYSQKSQFTVKLKKQKFLVLNGTYDSNLKNNNRQKVGYEISSRLSVLNQNKLGILFHLT